MTLVVRGFLTGIRRRVEALINIIIRREETGYAVFQYDEEWEFITHPEQGTVCPQCEGHSGTIFRGDQIPIEFPYYTYVSSNPHWARPRVHQPDLSQYFGEECHCDLMLLNPNQVIRQRLHDEMEAEL